MGIAQLGEAPRHEVERFVPGSRLELARLAILYERRADAVGRVDEIEACRASLHAQKPLVRRTGRRFGIHDGAVLHHEVQLTAHAAVRARGAHALGLPRAVRRAALLGERSGGARLRAVAARLAVGGAPVRAERRLDQRANAALRGSQRVVARGVVAGAHATLAANAQVRVVSEERVLVAHGLALLRCLERRLQHTVFAADGLQLAGAVLVAREAVVRGIEAVIGDDELERDAAVRLDARRGGGHLHTVLHRRGARGHRLVEPFHVHDAHAARGDGAALFQEAQRGDADAGSARGIEDGGAFGNVEGDPVYRDARHTGACLLP